MLRDLCATERCETLDELEHFKKLATIWRDRADELQEHLLTGNMNGEEKEYVETSIVLLTNHTVELEATIRAAERIEAKHEKQETVPTVADNRDSRRPNQRGSSRNQTRIGETVEYYHHHDARRAMAGLVIDEAEDGSVTVHVFTRMVGKTFPAFGLLEDVPTGGNGHFFRRKR